MNTISKSQETRSHATPSAPAPKAPPAASYRERLVSPLTKPPLGWDPSDERAIARKTGRGRDTDRHDLEPFQAPAQVLVPRAESATATAPVVNTRVAETQALVERLVTSMRVGRSVRGSEVHMTLDGPASSEVRVRQVEGRLEITLRGADSSAIAARIETALSRRGLDADVRCSA